MITNGNEKNGNGKWQLAFWLITAIAGIWLLVLTNGVVANDRIRATEDIRILGHLGQHEAAALCQYSDIVERLTRIETKIEMKLRK